ncbi:glutamine amidotransferase [Puteibacter caeruleilacunae]|nr:glutamine amidotransferase [Puteibacter caeruleilacunae]
MTKKIYIFLFDGYSDWEISYVTPEINKSEQFELNYFSFDGNSVSSMGGLKVTPNTALPELNIDEIDMLILPGGTAWESGSNEAITPFVKAVIEKGKPIAAICAATAYLGQLGVLDRVQHTSNDLYYLKAVSPQYTGDKNYINSLAVTGGNMITANGIAPIEFAQEVFKMLELYNDTDLEKWFQLFKNGVWSE